MAAKGTTLGQREKKGAGFPAPSLHVDRASVVITIPVPVAIMIAMAMVAAIAIVPIVAMAFPPAPVVVAVAPAIVPVEAAARANFPRAARGMMTAPAALALLPAPIVPIGVRRNGCRGDKAEAQQRPGKFDGKGGLHRIVLVEY